MSFPVVIVLLGLVAGFLILRLRSVLGKRTGFERAPLPGQPGAAPISGKVIDGRAEPVASAPSRATPSQSSPLGQTLAQIGNMDSQFEPAHFLAGAEQAFRMIVTAFAAGDRPTLHGLLSDSVYATFEQAISGRETAQEKQRTEIKAVLGASIEDAHLLGRHAAIIVKFVSDQVNVTTDPKGDIVAGTEAVTEIIDLWTFERELGAADPVWRLAAARSG
jgi:predicted lipid-binding transport protein (Tim44 family)